ncbi:MAG: hypothetical protein ACRC3Y_04205 [Romboutsia sp.]|uniref:hypothetical protein n=1 Tax=Romboutsia sp. TaxID=1965302 RepID=UPI003F2BD185
MCSKCNQYYNNCVQPLATSNYTGYSCCSQGSSSSSCVFSYTAPISQSNSCSCNNQNCKQMCNQNYNQCNNQNCCQNNNNNCLCNCRPQNCCTSNNQQVNNCGCVKPTPPTPPTCCYICKLYCY